ncbi:helicase associated domain-containing protein [Streptomyces sp. F001]|uniref:helicase associated domain-containing protein n=1 Tax=Streptomyces sp. F001 TaxID=1510026 RepID=UPI001F0DAD4B|nr:helicase associated domain-containing protein [Streptomyces sp. F001]
MKAGGVLPAGTGEVIVQGEDLGGWIAGQRVRWDKLVPARQYLLETLGAELADEDAQPARRSQSAAWERNVAAARQFHDREGHLTVPRKHVETVEGEPIRLGSFLDNSRRAARLSPQRRADLDALRMRW